MEARDLIHTKVFAERMRTVILSIVFIFIPVVMGFVLPVFYRDKLIGDIVVSLALLAIFIGISLIRMYWEIAGSARAELQCRDELDKKNLHK